MFTPLYRRSILKNTVDFRRYSSDPRDKLPHRIPTGGKHADENGHGVANGNGYDSGSMLHEGWKEQHASDSEAVVKAERHDSEKGWEPGEMQKRTVEHLEKHAQSKITKTQQTKKTDN